MKNEMARRPGCARKRKQDSHRKDRHSSVYFDQKKHCLENVKNCKSSSSQVTVSHILDPFVCLVCLVNCEFVLVSSFFTWLCVSVSVYLRVCLCVFMCLCVSMCLSVCLSMCVCLYKLVLPSLESTVPPRSPYVWRAA